MFAVRHIYILNAKMNSNFGVKTYEMKNSEFIIETTPIVENGRFVLSNYFGQLKRGDKIICEEYLFCQKCFQQQNTFKE